MRDGDWVMGWWWIWPALIVVGLVILGYLGVLLARGRVRGSREGEPDGGVRSSARRILDERYARGEIDEEEYLRRKAELR
ncbi:SHOCT domain-containing protein [Amycolatopsis sp. CA-161197]|uniref:SHOCT domain-containing protein n=1 Tax=Amycolatopsis sp. CA-161197 TaxID=3239922 RepID=UPI003D91FD99